MVTIKWVLRIIVGLVALLALALLVILLPAHLQVRSVVPSLPSQSELLALRDLTVKVGEAPTGQPAESIGGLPIRANYILTSSQQLDRGSISHISILVEWQDGKRFLIDTGMDTLAAHDFAALLKKMDGSASDASVQGTISQLLGDNIHQVDGVGFTHLHIDHTQGIGDFCGARGKGAIVLQTPSQRELHNYNTSEGADLVVDSCLEGASFLSKSNDNVYQSNLFPGLAAVELGGHTPGSTLWVVMLKEKMLLFSGDTTNDKASISDDVSKGVVYSYFVVPENTNRTAQLRAWLRELDRSELFSVIVSHDLANTQEHLEPFIKN